MKKKYINEINNIEDILKGKYKELQDILDSNSGNKNIIYIENITNEIENMEKEINELKIKNREDDNIIKNKTYKTCNHKNIDIREKKDNILSINDKKDFSDIETSISILKNIEEMEDGLNKHIELIKKQLNIFMKKDLNNYIKLIMDLNKISSKILLFKNNYIDYKTENTEFIK